MVVELNNDRGKAVLVKPESLLDCKMFIEISELNKYRSSLNKY